MSNAISLLQTDFKNHVVFAKSGITENKPLQGRPYGGCGIFTCKSFPCISNMVGTNCDRICAVLSEFTSFTILFISVLCYVTHIRVQFSAKWYTRIAGEI